MHITDLSLFSSCTLWDCSSSPKLEKGKKGIQIFYRLRVFIQIIENRRGRNLVCEIKHIDPVYYESNQTKKNYQQWIALAVIFKLTVIQATVTAGIKKSPSGYIWS